MLPSDLSLLVHALETAARDLRAELAGGPRVSYLRLADVSARLRVFAADDFALLNLAVNREPDTYAAFTKALGEFDVAADHRQARQNGGPN
jgi:hypothetical protein